MISVSQVYPLREVEEFTISPERLLAKERAESNRRVQDASTVRRLVTTESVADGTIFTLSPRTDLNFEMRSQLEEWLHVDPARRTAHWQNNLDAPLVWDVDKAAYTPAGLIRHIVEQATGISRDFLGTQWWRDPYRLDPGRVGGTARRRQGRHVPRVLVTLARQGPPPPPHWTQMSTLPAQNFITMPSPMRGTHYGLSFAAGGRLRSDFYVDLGSPRPARRSSR